MAEEYEWPMYELGALSLAVGPGPEDQDEYYFFLVVGNNGYPLARYPDMETAKEAASVLDQAMAEMMETAEPEIELIDGDDAPAKKGKRKAKPAAKKTAKKAAKKSAGRSAGKSTTKPAAKAKAKPAAKKAAKKASKKPAAKKAAPKKPAAKKAAAKGKKRR